MNANVGIAERGERLVFGLTAAGLVGLGAPQMLLTVVLGVLAAASAVTIVQRMLAVRRQVVAAESGDRASETDVAGGDAVRRPDATRGVLWAFRFFERAPEWLSRGVMSAAADLAWLHHGGGVRQLEANLRRARPDATRRELRRLSRAGMRTYLRYFAEAFAMPRLHSGAACRAGSPDRRRGAPR